MSVISFKRRLSIGIALLAGIGVLGVSHDVEAAVKDYTTVGNATYTAPANGVYTFEVWGAQGGGNSSTTGRGGYVKGTKTLKVGDTVSMVIGGVGSAGSGNGKNAGGGYTKVYLNGTSSADELATAAGGGGGPSGGDGGAGTGVGGSSVGSGAGTSGTLGGGGGSSPDYTYSSGYWQSTGHWETYSLYPEFESTYLKSPVSGWTCTNSVGPNGAWCWRYKTGTRWVDNGQQWVSTGYSYSSGNPGQGGSNSNGTKVLDSYLSQNGVRTGNGMVRITTPGKAPTLNVVASTTEWTNQDVLLTATATENMEPVDGILGPDGVFKSGTTLTYAATKNGSYPFASTNVSGDAATKSISVTNIDKVLPVGVLAKTVNLDSTVNLIVTGVSDDASGVLEIEKPDGTTVTGVTGTTYVAKTDGTYTFKIRDKAGNVRELSTVVTGVDIIPPTGILTQTPVGVWTTGSVTLNLSGIVDLGGSGYKETVKPDGTKTSATNISYVVTTNGSYTFVMYDNVGNKTTKTVNVTNLDNDRPNNPTLRLSNEDWALPGVEVTVDSNGDVVGGSGVNRLEYRINGGTWKTYVSKFSIPASYTGDVTIEARVVDNVGLVSDVVKKTTKIDDSLPTIDLLDIVTVDDRQELRISASDTLSGLSPKPYMLYRKEIGRDVKFEKVDTDWTNAGVFKLPVDKGNTKYLYRVDVRDIAGNIKTSRILTYVSPVDLSFNGVRENDNANNMTFDFTNPIDALGEVTIEITRGDSIVGRLTSGSSYLDKGLDYDRTYDYKLVAYTIENGERVSSLPIRLSEKIGAASIEGFTVNDVYTTPFNNTFTVKGSSRLKSGGLVKLTLRDGDKVLSKRDVNVGAYSMEDWTISGEYNGDDKKELTVVLELAGQEAIHNKKMTVTVSKKGVDREVVDGVKYSKIYGTR